MSPSPVQEIGKPRRNCKPARNVIHQHAVVLFKWRQSCLIANCPYGSATADKLWYNGLSCRCRSAVLVDIVISFPAIPEDHLISTWLIPALWHPQPLQITVEFPVNKPHVSINFCHHMIIFIPAVPAPGRCLAFRFTATLGQVRYSPAPPPR